MDEESTMMKYINYDYESDSDFDGQVSEEEYVAEIDEYEEYFNGPVDGPEDPVKAEPKSKAPATEDEMQAAYEQYLKKTPWLATERARVLAAASKRPEVMAWLKAGAERTGTHYTYNQLHAMMAADTRKELNNLRQEQDKLQTERERADRREAHARYRKMQRTLTARRRDNARARASVRRPNAMGSMQGRKIKKPTVPVSKSALRLDRRQKRLTKMSEGIPTKPEITTEPKQEETKQDETKQPKQEETKQEETKQPKQDETKQDSKPQTMFEVVIPLHHKTEPKQTSKQTSKQTPKETSKQTPKETPKQTPEDVAKDLLNNMYKPRPASDAEIRAEAFAKLADRKALVQQLERTVMCRSVTQKTRCPHGKRCRYAHTLDELNKRECLYRHTCRLVQKASEGCYINTGKKVCNGWHPQETEDSYCTRLRIPQAKSPPKSTAPKAKPAPWADARERYRFKAPETKPEIRSESKMPPQRQLRAGIIMSRKLPGKKPEYLMVHRKSCDKWSFPKGGVEPGETLQQAAVRETREETGYIVEIPSTAKPILYGRSYYFILYYEQHCRQQVPRTDRVDMYAWCHYKPHTSNLDMYKYFEAKHNRQQHQKPHRNRKVPKPQPDADGFTPVVRRRR